MPTVIQGNNSVIAGNTSFTGNTVFSFRPVFNNQTPWDSGNFNPANYFPLRNMLGGFGYEIGRDYNTLLTVGDTRFINGSTANNSPIASGNHYYFGFGGGDSATGRGAQMVITSDSESYFRVNQDGWATWNRYWTSKNFNPDTKVNVANAIFTGASTFQKGFQILGGFNGDNNASIEMGRVDGVASTPYIDFHSGATATDFEARIIATGGTGVAGGGNLSIQAASISLSSRPQFNSQLAWDAGNLNPQNIVVGSRSRHLITGGGNLSVSSASEVNWTNRFIIMGGGTDSYSTAGYYNVFVPAANSVVNGYAGLSNVTVTSAGIPMADWATLYAIPTAGDQNSISLALVGFGQPFTVPQHWVPLIRRHNDTVPPQYVFPNGFTLIPGETVNAGDRYNYRNTSLTISSPDSANGQIQIINSSGGGGRVVFAQGANNVWTQYATSNTFNFYSHVSVTDVFKLAPTSITLNAATTINGKVIITPNGDFNGLQVGDDTVLGDVNKLNTLGLKGLSDGTIAFLQMGSAGSKMGYDGNNWIVNGGGNLFVQPSAGGNYFVWHSGNFDAGAKANLSGSTFSGTVTAPIFATPANGNNWLANGNGDGASYTISNMRLRVHNGLGLESYDGTVNGFYDSRNGFFDTKGVPKVNGQNVWYPGNFNPSSYPTTGSNARFNTVGIGNGNPQIYTDNNQNLVLRTYNGSNFSYPVIDGNGNLSNINTFTCNQINNAGTTYSGAIIVTNAYIDLLKANVLRSRILVDEYANTIFRNGDNGDNLFFFTNGGRMWCKEFGYINDRIEDRAAAYADARLVTATNRVNAKSFRMTHAGDLYSDWNRDQNNFAEPYGGGVMTTINFISSGQPGDRIGGARWRYTQMSDSNGNWYTCGYA